MRKTSTYFVNHGVVEEMNNEDKEEIDGIGPLPLQYNAF